MYNELRCGIGVLPWWLGTSCARAGVLYILARMNDDRRDGPRAGPRCTGGCGSTTSSCLAERATNRRVYVPELQCRGDCVIAVIMSAPKVLLGFLSVMSLVSTPAVNSPPFELVAHAIVHGSHRL